jgi:hypothetical protein
LNVRASEQAQAGTDARMRTLAVRLQIARGMSRLFLSAQMTCAMLLGAGLLLRAQAALRSEPGPAAQVAAVEATQAPPTVHKTSQSRKAVAHQIRRSRVRKCGVALAGRPLRCG